MEGAHSENGGYGKDFVEKVCMHRRIARRIQYALPFVEKPGLQNRPRGVCYLNPFI